MIPEPVSSGDGLWPTTYFRVTVMEMSTEAVISHLIMTQTFYLTLIDFTTIVLAIVFE